MKDPSEFMIAKAQAQVTDYLLKRGFNRTEEVFRQESKHLGPDGKPIYQLANLGPKKYQRAFGLLREWVENNLDIYKVCHDRPPAVSFADNPSSNCPSCCGPSSSILS
jgi:transcription initiation factor TFIID subunit 5